MIQVPRVLALVPPARLVWGNALAHLLVSRDVLGALGMCWELGGRAGSPVPPLHLHGAGKSLFQRRCWHQAENSHGLGWQHSLSVTGRHDGFPAGFQKWDAHKSGVKRHLHGEAAAALRSCWICRRGSLPREAPCC